jgi:hypothetical protein
MTTVRENMSRELKHEVPVSLQQSLAGGGADAAAAAGASAAAAVPAGAAV